MILDERLIVESSRRALERAANQNIKNFAQTMVTEHSRALDQLSGIRGAERTTTAKVDPGHPKGFVPARSGIVVRDEQGKLRGGRLIYRPTDFLEVKEQVYDHLRSSMEKEWEGITGSEFDRAYIKHMIAAHEGMLASCKALRQSASEDLGKVIDAGTSKLENHLRQARRLSDQLFGAASGRGK
jgi:predicted outer membrane protein